MSEKRPGRDINILIVDDTPDNLRLLSQILSARQYHVRVATGGERALESVRMATPDLILMDIKMPGMNGFEVCRRLKADSTMREIPVIFISALDDVADKVQAFAVGGVDYITKPFQHEEVLARVETHLSLRSLQMQLERANQKMAQELVLAGQLQATFLPDRLPEIPGWQFAVTLEPAHETSGDFYDLFALPDGRLGLLVADVVDKGVCAALFMALTYALFRSQAQEYPYEPAQVLQAVNRHIMTDTHANQFVTAFYGVLDPASGRLIYGNAGHCPPLLLNQTRPSSCEWLDNLGIPLGLLETFDWGQREVVLEPGAALVLYTDGVIEAENEDEALYGRERLLALAQRHVNRTAGALRDVIVADVRAFREKRPLLDDSAVLVVRRDAQQ